MTPKDANTVAHITDRIDEACRELSKIAGMLAGYPELDDSCASLREVLAILEVRRASFDRDRCGNRYRPQRSGAQFAKFSIETTNQRRDPEMTPKDDNTVTDRIDEACRELTKIADMLAGYPELDDTVAPLREVLAILEVRRASFDREEERRGLR
jgi:hypothetical protein